MISILFCFVQEKQTARHVKYCIKGRMKIYKDNSEKRVCVLTLSCINEQTDSLYNDCARAHTTAVGSLILKPVEPQPTKYANTDSLSHVRILDIILDKYHFQ